MQTNPAEVVAVITGALAELAGEDGAEDRIAS